MNKEIQKLCLMADKESRLIVGLMSGTSLDGLDIALCRIHGSGRQTRLAVEEFETLPYSEDFKADVKSVFSKQQVDLQKLSLLNVLIGTLHADMILSMLGKWGVSASDIDCIASHGQTIYHAPRRLHQLTGYPDATLQIGDGDHLAVKTAILTLSDFRQKHIAAGGEGAPLALYGDYILFSSEEENRILLNIGGISNFTYLPGDGNASRVVCTDTGPGNTLTDALSRKYFNSPFDNDGTYARSGKVIPSLLNAMLAHPFFREDLPKTTGPELFNLNFVEESKALAGISEANPADVIATVSLLTAHSIANGIKEITGKENLVVYVSGGGCHNSYIMEEIQKCLPHSAIKRTEELGFNADAKEAALFALLANETICGSVIQTGGGPAVMMGKISLPL
ncbi:anhydro-N-acetylmuramic acid kinase [Arcticibacter tournemirensis]|uniref:Anhydro-N-acetylmuramic acid kinase n=1 Tax=Arcticibacter tournemirensis TaxID=699437 RepID=A0A5M9HFF3_9SPHI|nr:anhydro-N-acetylmuramic acid kinase [Arcticibacter tournemirensis]KAA8485530.1 anhydro-N-acetylmuramic acid kinase [Arcticibacter tournemirensis]TQM48759.1 anhydro-N-acetylmuramic acid kinase [Arcticibacter tournemirensis]